MRRAVALVAAMLPLAACNDNYVAGPVGLNPPTNLTYQLIPSGDPDVPEGIRLRWDPQDDPFIANYVVYSRASTSDPWSRRAETTSASFDDLGVPDLQYYVAAQEANGAESAGSNIVTVDPANRLEAPATLVPISLNTAIQLSWSSDARTAAPDLFNYYRVYSASYDLRSGNCGADWVLEGTTVSEDFLASGLPNGVPRCFTVSTISRDGHESDWTAPISDTPRPDARNVLILASPASVDSSGFIFFASVSQRFGLVVAGDRPDADFVVEQQPDGSLWMVPVRTGTTVALYDLDEPVEDLTSIDRADFAEDSFLRSPVEAVPGFAYVFRTTLGDGVHYAGVRVTHVTPYYMIFDWSYQTDPGNPDLRRVR